MNITEITEALTRFGKLFNRKVIEQIGVGMSVTLAFLIVFLDGFAHLWLTFYLFVMFAMCINNLFWIPSSPEFKEFLGWNLIKKLRYMIGYRVFLVIIHPFDIIPAIITSRVMIWGLRIMGLI